MKVNEYFRIAGDETFSLLDNKVVLNRYKVTWETVQPLRDEDGKILADVDNEGKRVVQKETVLNVSCFTSHAAMSAFVGDNSDGMLTVTEIDQTGNEWIEGMEFPGYTEAKNALDGGETNYRIEAPPYTLEQLSTVVDALLISSLRGGIDV